MTWMTLDLRTFVTGQINGALESINELSERVAKNEEKMESAMEDMERMVI